VCKLWNTHHCTSFVVCMDLGVITSHLTSTTSSCDRCLAEEVVDRIVSLSECSSLSKNRVVSRLELTLPYDIL